MDITTVTPGRVIDLGTKNAGQLGLTDTELGHVITSNLLRIGSNATVPGGAVPANTGGIIITCRPITTHAGYNTLSLITAGGVSETGSGALSVTNLAVQAGTGINLGTNPERRQRPRCDHHDRRLHLARVRQPHRDHRGWRQRRHDARLADPDRYHTGRRCADG